MKTKSLIQTSWIVFAVAIAAWAGTAYFGLIVFGMQSKRAAYASNIQNVMLERAQAVQARAIARETILERQFLEENSSIDLISAVNMIEAVGESAGTKVSVNDAQSEKPIAAKAGTPSTNVVNFAVSTKGSFASVMKVLQMLEALPLAVTIQQVNFSKIQDLDSPKNATWSLHLNLKFITTAAVSS